ncbi:helix-turn-helix domain-containing protein [Gloeobacter kilaueensis]|uniref:helix-turn-helix domain-containing protein n=1 Tax=Gloeobacter kilaueensis TaxID=1416614 RepID=UPI0008FFCD27|nr:helix-turn-helix domain-containing protein [Gloeobacter kilaueensis]
MPYHRIYLTPQEEDDLQKLSDDLTVPQRVRQRAQTVRLSMHGMTAPQIAAYLGCAPSTVRTTFRRWWDHGLQGLFEAKGRGARPKLAAEDFEFLRQQMQQHPKAYNARHLATLLQQRGVQVHPDYLRQVLKKKDSVGKE